MSQSGPGSFFSPPPQSSPCQPNWKKKKTTKKDQHPWFLTSSFPIFTVLFLPWTKKFPDGSWATSFFSLCPGIVLHSSIEPNLGNFFFTVSPTWTGEAGPGEFSPPHLTFLIHLVSPSFFFRSTFQPLLAGSGVPLLFFHPSALFWISPRFGPFCDWQDGEFCCPPPLFNPLTCRLIAPPFSFKSCDAKS